jgi:hypothetical protein
MQKVSLVKWFSQKHTFALELPREENIAAVEIAVVLFSILSQCWMRPTKLTRSLHASKCIQRMDPELYLQ